MQMTRIYIGILELIVAVILGQNLLQVDDVFIPIQNIFNYNGFIDAAGVILIYTFVISGWIGYHRSISQHQHRGNLGNLRYGIDLTIVFFIYYLVSITNPTSTGKFGDAFIWIFPLIFFLYLVWDLVKMAEHRHKKGKSKRTIRMLITLAFLFTFLVQSYSYQNSLNDFVNPYPDPSSNKTYIDGGYILSSGILIAFYRIWKWPITVQSVSKPLKQ